MVLHLHCWMFFELLGKRKFSGLCYLWQIVTEFCLLMMLLNCIIWVCLLNYVHWRCPGCCPGMFIRIDLFKIWVNYLWRCPLEFGDVKGLISLTIIQLSPCLEYEWKICFRLIHQHTSNFRYEFETSAYISRDELCPSWTSYLWHNL